MMQHGAWAGPVLYTRQVTTPDCARVELRPAGPADATVLGDYFLSLSKRTRELFAPHDFTRDEAQALCSERKASGRVPLLAVGSGDTRVVAYFLLCLNLQDGAMERYARYGIALSHEQDCLIAPSVADQWQGRGLGGLFMRYAVDLAQSLGRRYMVLFGGTSRRNHRAIRLYEKSGFRIRGYFGTNDSEQDMLLELQPAD
ncbi:MAG: GNAT family N-acetyltransferase [Chitinivibrionales bacterium]|nr:GNAT family N-acetyltransferase [Chitinivibrionales bacterium]